MKCISANKNPLLCPSAPPEMGNTIVFGVISGTVEAPRVTYLKKGQSVTEELMALSESVEPTEVFRIATSCATKKCQHFDGKNCRLATRIVQKLPTVVDELPSCVVRGSCRWWKQEGKAACLRCPQVITDNYNPSELMNEVGNNSCRLV